MTTAFIIAFLTTISIIIIVIIMLYINMSNR